MNIVEELRNKTSRDNRDLLDRAALEIEDLERNLEAAYERIERLNIELKAMRGAANSLKMHYENAKVEVVRCKDCKHNVANWQHEELDGTDYTDITCDYFMTDGMHGDDFCSYGERIRQ